MSTRSEGVDDVTEQQECICTSCVVDYSDPERYHPENIDPACPIHGTAGQEREWPSNREINEAIAPVPQLFQQADYEKFMRVFTRMSDAFNAQQAQLRTAQEERDALRVEGQLTLIEKDARTAALLQIVRHRAGDTKYEWIRQIALRVLTDADYEQDQDWVDALAPVVYDTLHTQQQAEQEG